MRFSAAFVALAAPYLAMAAPFKRQASAADLLVLKFANVLEQLESTFYTQALQKFSASDFTSAGFTSAQVAIEQINSILSDETAHTSILAQTIQSLGDQPLNTCTFDFSSVLDSVTSMVPVARLVENVGVGAYLGAAHLIDDPRLLTAAGSILPIEARHQTMLNVFAGGSAIPQAFEIPLRPEQVLSLAGGFIQGCSLGITPNPPVTLSNTGLITAGTTLQLSSPGITGLDPSTLTCQMIVGGAPFAIALPLNQCVVPSGIDGPVALFIANTTQPLLNNVDDVNAVSIVAGPAMIFLDTQPQTIASLVRNTAGSVGNTPSNTVTTISPAEASAIASSGTVVSGQSNNGSTFTPSSGSGSTFTPNGSVNTPAQVADPAGTISPDGAAMVLGWANDPAQPSNLTPVPDNTFSTPNAVANVPAAVSSPAAVSPAAAAPVSQVATNPTIAQSGTSETTSTGPTNASDVIDD